MKFYHLIYREGSRNYAGFFPADEAQLLFAGHPVKVLILGKMGPFTKREVRNFKKSNETAN